MSLPLEENVSTDEYRSEEPNPEYIPSDKCIESKPGYVFKMGAMGLGYYLDRQNIPSKDNDDSITDEVTVDIIYPLEKYVIKLGMANSSGRVFFVTDPDDISSDKTGGLLVILFDKAGLPEDLRLIFPPNVKSSDIKYDIDKFTVYDKEHSYDDLEIAVDRCTGAYLFNRVTEERVFNLPDDIPLFLKMNMLAQYYRASLVDNNIFVSLISFRNVLPNKHEVKWTKEANLMDGVDVVYGDASDTMEKLKDTYFVYEDNKYPIMSCIYDNNDETNVVTMSVNGKSEPVKLAYLDYKEDALYGKLLENMNITQTNLLELANNQNENLDWYERRFKIIELSTRQEIHSYYKNLWNISTKKEEYNTSLLDLDDNKRAKEIKNRISVNKVNKEINTVNSYIEKLDNILNEINTMGEDIYKLTDQYTQKKTVYYQERLKVEMDVLESLKSKNYDVDFSYTNIDMNEIELDKMDNDIKNIKKKKENIVKDFDEIVIKIDNNTPKHLTYEYKNVDDRFANVKFFETLDYYQQLFKNISINNAEFAEKMPELYKIYSDTYKNVDNFTITLDMIQSDSIPMSIYTNFKNSRSLLKKDIDNLRKSFNGKKNKTDDTRLEKMLSKFEEDRKVLESNIKLMDNNLPEYLKYVFYNGYNRTIYVITQEQNAEKYLLSYQDIWLEQSEKLKNNENTDIEDDKQIASNMLEKLTEWYSMKEQSKKIKNSIHRSIQNYIRVYDGINTNEDLDNTIKELIDKLLENMNKLSEINTEVLTATQKAGYNVLEYVKKYHKDTILEVEETDAVEVPSTVNDTTVAIET